MRTVPAICRLSVIAAAALIVAALPVQAAGPLQYHSIAPCRLVDTRDASGASNEVAGARTNPGPHTFRAQGFCGVPVGARAVSLNVTVISPTQGGDLRLFPSDGGTPVVGVMSYNQNEFALGNGAILPLGQVAGDDIRMLIGMACGTGCGSIQVTMDVTGYFTCINAGSC